MKTHYLKHGNSYYAIKIKKEILSDNDFSYTESGNDITVTSYIGSDTDVKIINKINDMYCLARPSPYIPEYKLNVAEYNYTNNNGEVVLTLYTGNGGEVDTPQLEEI